MFKILGNTFTNLTPLKVEAAPADQVLINGSPVWREWPQVFGLKATVDYNVFGKKIGALYLKPHQGQDPTFVFGFDVQGTHVYDLARTIESFYDNWRSGLKCAFPKHISWKIHVGYRKCSARKTEELTEVALNCPHPTLAHLTCDQIVTIQELTRQGDRCDRFTHLYVYYWGNRDRLKGQAEGALEASIKEVSDVVYGIKAQFTGKKQQTEARRAEEEYTSAYYQGFQFTSDHLTSTLGLPVEPMDHDTLWSNLRARFSGHDAGPSPHVVHCKINRQGIFLNEDYEPSPHICNALVKDGQINLNESGVSIKRWNAEEDKFETDYIGLLAATQKFEGWPHGYGQLKGLHDPFTDPKVEGVEFFVDISSSSAKVQKANAQEAHRRAVTKASKAAETKEFSAAANRALQESEQILADYDSGDTTLRISFAALVHSSSINELDMKCQSFQNLFKLTPLQREFTATGRVWLQTLPCMPEHLLNLKILVMGFGAPMPSVKLSHRLTYNTEQAMGIFPMTRTVAHDRSGIEMIATDKQFVNIDLFSATATKHWAALAEQRKGKSVVAQVISDRAISQRQPVTWIDIPPENNSPLKNRCDLFDGSHIDIKEQSLNFLGITSALLLQSSPLSTKVRASRFKLLQTGWLSLLMTLGGPPKEKIHLAQVTRTILETAIDLFVNDHNIQSRYVSALKAGFGSREWHGDPDNYGRGGMPTLCDFYEFLQPYRLQEALHSMDGVTREALDLLLVRLAKKADPSTSMGAAISRPSTVDVEKSFLTVFSLSGVEFGTEDALAYCAAAYTSAMQKSLSHPISHLIFEEAHKVADEPGVLQMMSDSITMLGKSGVRTGIVTNSFAAVAKSKAGQNLIDNLTTKFIGKIQPGSAQNLSKLLQIPIELMKICSNDNFNPIRKAGCSQWLVFDGGKHTIARLHPGWMSLALGLSNSDQGLIKQKFFELISDPVVAIRAFTLYFRHCCESEIDLVCPEADVIERYAKKCS